MNIYPNFFFFHSFNPVVQILSIKGCHHSYLNEPVDGYFNFGRYLGLVVKFLMN